MKVSPIGVSIAVITGVMLASGLALAGDPDSSEIARKWVSQALRPVSIRVKAEASAKTSETDASVVATSPERLKTTPSRAGRPPQGWSTPESLH